MSDGYAMWSWEIRALEAHGRRICAAYPEVRVELCDACGSEGRILVTDYYYDHDGLQMGERDEGPCPWCEGTGREIIPVEPVDDDEDYLNRDFPPGYWEALERDYDERAGDDDFKTGHTVPGGFRRRD